MKDLLVSSFRFLQNHRFQYAKIFIAIWLLGFFHVFPWELTNLGPNSTIEILVNIILAILELMLIVSAINLTYARMFNKERERLIYTLPTFLIHSLYYVFITVAGLFLFIVPGLWTMTYFAFVPQAAMFAPEESAFKKSRALVSKKPLLVFSLVLFSLVTEFIPAGLLYFLPSWLLKLFAQAVMGPLIAILDLVTIIAFVRLYFELNGRPFAHN